MRILQNAIQTADGTILLSTNTKDVITHLDKNQELYAITGGSISLERPGATGYTELSITDQHSLEHFVNNLVWKTYGSIKEERKPENMKYIKLVDLESRHLEALTKLPTISQRHKFVISEILVKRNYWPLRFKKEKQQS